MKVTFKNSGISLLLFVMVGSSLVPNTKLEAGTISKVTALSCASALALMSLSNSPLQFSTPAKPKTVNLESVYQTKVNPPVVLNYDSIDEAYGILDSRFRPGDSAVIILSPDQEKNLIPIDNWSDGKHDGYCVGVDCINFSMMSFIDFQAGKSKQSSTEIYLALIGAGRGQRETISGYANASEFYNEMHLTFGESSNPLRRAIELLQIEKQDRLPKVESVHTYVTLRQEILNFAKSDRKWHDLLLNPSIDRVDNLIANIDLHSPSDLPHLSIKYLRWGLNAMKAQLITSDPNKAELVATLEHPYSNFPVPTQQEKSFLENQSVAENLAVNLTTFYLRGEGEVSPKLKDREYLMALIDRGVPVEVSVALLGFHRIRIVGYHLEKGKEVADVFYTIDPNYPGEIRSNLRLVNFRDGTTKNWIFASSTRSLLYLTDEQITQRWGSQDYLKISARDFMIDQSNLSRTFVPHIIKRSVEAENP